MEDALYIEQPTNIPENLIIARVWKLEISIEYNLPPSWPTTLHIECSSLHIGSFWTAVRKQFEAFQCDWMHITLMGYDTLYRLGT